MVSSYDILNTISAQNAAAMTQTYMGQQASLMEHQARLMGQTAAGVPGAGAGFAPMPGAAPGMVGMGPPPSVPFMPGIPAAGPAFSMPGGGLGFYHPSVGSALTGAWGRGPFGGMTQQQFGFGADALRGQAMQASAGMFAAGAALAMPSLAHHIGTPIAQFGLMASNSPALNPFAAMRHTLPGMGGFAGMGAEGLSMGQRASMFGRGLWGMGEAASTGLMGDIGAGMLGGPTRFMFGETAGNLAGTLGRGMGGIARVGGGLAAGLLPGLVAAEAIAYGPRKLYEGAMEAAQFDRNVGEMGDALLPFGGGGKRGSGFGRRELAGMHRQFREMAEPGSYFSSGNTMENMDVLTGLTAGLVGSGDLSQASSGADFMKQVRQQLRQLKAVSKVTRQTLEEAAQTFSELRQSGFRDTGEQINQALAERGLSRITGLEAGEVAQVRATGAATGRQVLGGRAGARIGARGLQDLQARLTLGGRAGLINEEALEGLGGATGAAETIFGATMGLVGNMSEGQLRAQATRMGLGTQGLGRDQLAQMLSMQPGFLQNFAGSIAGGNVQKGLQQMGLGDPGLLQVLDQYQQNYGTLAIRQAAVNQQVAVQDTLDAARGARGGGIGRALGAPFRMAGATISDLGAGAFRGTRNFLEDRFGDRTRTSTLSETDLWLVGRQGRAEMAGGSLDPSTGGSRNVRLSDVTGSGIMTALAAQYGDPRAFGTNGYLASGHGAAGLRAAGAVEVERAGTGIFLPSNWDQTVNQIARAQAAGAGGVTGKLEAYMAGVQPDARVTDISNREVAVDHLIASGSLGTSERAAAMLLKGGPSAARDAALRDPSHAIHRVVGILSTVRGGSLARYFEPESVPLAQTGMSPGTATTKILGELKLGNKWFSSGRATGKAVESMLNEESGRELLGKWLKVRGSGIAEEADLASQVASQLGTGISGTERFDELVKALNTGSTQRNVLGLLGQAATHEYLQAARQSTRSALGGVESIIRGLDASTKKGADQKGSYSRVATALGQLEKTLSDPTTGALAARRANEEAILSVVRGDQKLDTEEMAAFSATSLGPAAMRVYEELGKKPTGAAAKQTAEQRAAGVLGGLGDEAFAAAGTPSTSATVESVSKTFNTFAANVVELATIVSKMK